MEELELQLAKAAQMTREGGSVCVLTGAGISAESGIPTFRGDDGIWSRFPPDLFARRLGLVFTFFMFPSWFREFLVESMKLFVQASPNPAHTLLASFEQSGLLKGIITQNVDELHQDAGSQSVLEVHGSFFRSRCQDCDASVRIEKSTVLEWAERLHSENMGRWKMWKMLRREVLCCQSCRGRRMPALVLFGDPLPEEVWDASVALAKTCKVMWILGTSAAVQPVASLPFLAKEAGATLIEINPELSGLSHFVDVHLPMKGQEALERLAELLGNEEEGARRSGGD